LINPETQTSIYSTHFTKLEQLIDDVSNGDFTRINLVGREANGLLRSAKWYLERGRIDLALKYYWRIFIDGVEFHQGFSSKFLNGAIPPTHLKELVSPGISKFVEAGNKLARLIYGNDISPEDKKEWNTVEFILKHGLRLCEAFDLKDKYKMVNNLSIFQRSNALSFAEDDIETSREILEAQVSNLKRLVSDFKVNFRDPNSVMMSVEHHNNLAVIYTDLAGLTLGEKLKGITEGRDINFLINISKAQDEINSQLNIIKTSKFEDYPNLRLKRAMLLSNLSFTYVLISHYLLGDPELDSVEPVVQCLQDFKKDFFGAGNVFQGLPKTQEVSTFDAELYRTTADILTILLGVRCRFGYEVPIEYEVEENEITEPFITSENHREYALDRENWFIETISSYLDYSYERTHEYDDKIRLLQSATRFKNIVEAPRIAV
jgi:hypothetical protein